MTDTDIIIAVAKLDGWIYYEESNIYQKQFTDRTRTLDGALIEKHLSSYLTSRDAIIPVIEKILGSNKAQLYVFYRTLKVMIFGEDFTNVEEDEPMIHQYLIAEPKTLCIALLKATNNWTKE